jgi:hypothetical protein
MTSQRKLESARTNGAKSRGPRTPEGRAKSAMNALVHGLFARQVVLSCEELADFHSLRESCIAELLPHTPVEAALVEQIVASAWRLKRIRGLETATLELEIMRQEEKVQSEFESAAPEIRIALAFRTLGDTSRILDLINRYETRYRRSIERSLGALYAHRTPREPSDQAHEWWVSESAGRNVSEARASLEKFNCGCRPDIGSGKASGSREEPARGAALNPAEAHRDHPPGEGARHVEKVSCGSSGSPESAVQPTPPKGGGRLGPRRGS